MKNNKKIVSTYEDTVVSNGSVNVSTLVPWTRKKLILESSFKFSMPVSLAALETWLELLTLMSQLLLMHFLRSCTFQSYGYF